MSLLTGNANCVKYTLFVFNLVFMITGIILIGIGVGVTAAYTEYDIFLQGKFFSIPTFLIVIGSFVIVISFFGCWGALRENYYMILAFSVLLSLIFILELAAGISGYVLRSDAQKLIDETLQESLQYYNQTHPNANTDMWDFVQREFTCCGITNYKDWVKALNETETEDLPLSCCRIPNGIVGNFSCNGSLENKNRYSAGCLTTFSNYIAAHAVSLGAAGVVIAIIQFFGVIFACYIAREVRIRNGITGFP